MSTPRCTASRRDPKPLLLPPAAGAAQLDPAFRRRLFRQRALLPDRGARSALFVLVHHRDGQEHPTQRRNREEVAGRQLLSTPRRPFTSLHRLCVEHELDGEAEGTHVVSANEFR